MRQHFPMNLRGKQIGHILGYIPGALYGQPVLQGMSRAYQGVLEEANRIVEFRLRAATPASSDMTPAAPPADLLCPRRAGFGIRCGVITPDAAGFQQPWGGVLFVRYEQPCDAGSYDPGYPSGDYDSCSDDSGYPSGDYDFCSDNSGKLSIPDGRVKATASMEPSHLRGQRGRYASWDEQRQRETPSLRKGVSVAEAAKRSSIASI